MRYKQLRIYEEDEIEQILQTKNKTMLRRLCMSLGEKCEDYFYAQNIFVGLLNEDDLDIRNDAILGLSYLARTHRYLDRNVVEPLLIREAISNIKNNGDIMLCIEDIQIFLGWDVLNRFNKKYKVKFNTILNLTYMIHTKEVFANYADICYNLKDKVCDQCRFLQVEKNYISAVIELLETSCVERLMIKNFAYNSKYITSVDKLSWNNEEWLGRKDIALLISDVLRGKCWCQLWNDSVFVNIDRWNNVYFSCDISLNKAIEICSRYRLSCDLLDNYRPVIGIDTKI